MPNKALQRTNDHRGRTALAMDCVLAGTETQPGRPLNSIVRLHFESAGLSYAASSPIPASFGGGDNSSLRPAQPRIIGWGHVSEVAGTSGLR